MSHEDNMTQRMLRNMAWCRAKGEMQSMLTTFYQDNGRPGQFVELEKAINEFVEKVEQEGLRE